MKLRAITKCGPNNCPTIYETGDDTNDLVIQGYTVTMPDTPDGEQLVRVPRSLFEGVDLPIPAPSKAPI